MSQCAHFKQGCHLTRLNMAHYSVNNKQGMSELALKSAKFALKLTKMIRNH